MAYPECPTCGYTFPVHVADGSIVCPVDGTVLETDTFNKDMGIRPDLETDLPEQENLF